MSIYDDEPTALDHDVEQLLDELVLTLTGRGVDFPDAVAAVRRASTTITVRWAR